jgi:hypothetical protein
MAHSDFAWRKILSFFGAAALVLTAFVTIASGITLAVDGLVFNGVMSCIGGASAFALAVILYKDYQKWSDKNLSAVKRQR